MGICLKENKNAKWIIFTVIISILINESLDDEQAELVGELLALAGGVLIILGL